MNYLLAESVSNLMSKCIWCTRDFESRDADSPRSIYSLDNAGVTICWNCADRYELEQLRYHIDKLSFLLEDGRAHTEHGTVLPLSLKMKYRNRVVAVDQEGKIWHGRVRGSNIKLHPVKEKRNS